MWLILTDKLNVTYSYLEFNVQKYMCQITYSITLKDITRIFHAIIHAIEWEFFMQLFT